MVFATRQLHLTSTILLGLGNLRLAPVRRRPTSVIPGRASTRRYSINASAETDLGKIQSDMIELQKMTSPSVVALLSYFPGPENREIPYSTRRGTGFFVDSDLIVTSARVVGAVSTVHDSDRSSVVHNCFLARSIAVTVHEKVLCTRPAAVYFGGDIAVLEVLNPREMAGDLPPPLAVAKAVPDIDGLLLGIARLENATALMHILRGCRRQPGKSVRPKAPWPLDEQLEWIDYGAGERRDNPIIITLPDICGSPWFNLDKEVVGMASWAAEEADGCIISYSVPPSGIEHIVGYAKTKGLDGPIVLDPWINSLTIADNTSDITKECVPQWTYNVIVQMYI